MRLLSSLLALFLFSPVVFFDVPLQSADAAASCVVTLNGGKYDATGYQHPGGDQIQAGCGTDISSACNGAHGTDTCNSYAQTYLKVLQAPPAPPPAPAPPANTTPPASGGQSGGVVSAPPRQSTPTPGTNSGSTTPSTTTPSNPSTTASCIVTIQGHVFDATNYNHPGGNQISSACGTDISTACAGTHGADDCMSMSHQYLTVLSAGSAGGSSSSTTTTQPVSSAPFSGSSNSFSSSNPSSSYGGSSNALSSGNTSPSSSLPWYASFIPNSSDAATFKTRHTAVTAIGVLMLIGLL